MGKHKRTAPRERCRPFVFLHASGQVGPRSGLPVFVIAVSYTHLDDEDIEDLIDKIKDFYETASNSLVNIHGNIQVLDGIKKDAKTISVAFSEVEKGIASTDDLDTLLMFSKDPLSKIERILSTLQAVQKDIEYVARDVEKMCIRDSCNGEEDA